MYYNIGTNSNSGILVFSVLTKTFFSSLLPIAAVVEKTAAEKESIAAVKSSSDGLETMRLFSGGW